MRSYKTMLIGSAIVLAALLLTAAYAQSGKGRPDFFHMNGQAGAPPRPDAPPPPPPPPPGGLNPHLLSRLNLSDAQREQIRALHENARNASQTHMEKMREIQDQLESVVEAATFDEAQARTLLAAKSQAMIELDILRLRTDSAVYNLLTAEQKTRLEQLKQERPEFSPKDGHRPPPPPQD